ncbi:(2Fe-2S)-binding protein [Streptomyces sp. NPDC054784]
MPVPASAPTPATPPAPVPSPGPSPVAAAYARLAEVLPDPLVVESAVPPTGDGWVSAVRLATDGPALDAFLAYDAEQVVRDHGREARPDVVAGFALHRYVWPVCLLVTTPWFLHRRVPRLPPESVSFHPARGRLAVSVREFACLPGDPAAALPGARAVPDEAALRAEVRTSVAEHLGPVLDAFGPRMRRGRRALWGTATDDLAEGLWHLGTLVGEERRAVTEAGLLLPGGTPPYTRGAAFRELRGPAGEALPTRDRASCCFYYTLRPDDACGTCPRTCDAERIERTARTR